MLTDRAHASSSHLNPETQEDRSPDGLRFTVGSRRLGRGKSGSDHECGLG
jgi:hypothetical protein